MHSTQNIAEYQKTLHCYGENKSTKQKIKKDQIKQVALTKQNVKVHNACGNSVFHYDFEFLKKI